MGKWGKIEFFCLALLVTFYISGCGNVQKGETVNFNHPLPVKNDSPQVNQFNQQLGGIKDLPTAEKAVNSFIDYADSRIEKPAGALHAQSLRALMTDTLVEKVARRELLARSISLPQAQAGSEETIPEPLLDIGAITDTVNNLGSDQGVRVDDATVRSAKEAVEANLPNLNPAQSDQMTPLNAMVVGYALASGDDGSAAESSVKVPLDKAASFVDTVTQ
jgi:hypothetical protein